MLAFLYLAVAVWLGDILCRRFFRYVSVFHRAAAAVLVGLVVGTWVTYLGASAFGRSPVPLLAGNLVFVAFAEAVRRYWPRNEAQWQVRPPGRAVWDAVFVLVLGAFVSWFMWHSLRYGDGALRMGSLQWSDFGATLAIVQSFALGQNFPPQYPHFPGPAISYHFLFHFQAGNLEWLGLRLDHSFNFLSIVTLLSFVLLLMTLGERLFGSRAVGRLSAVLFFFHSSLNYVSFLYSKGSIAKAAAAAWAPKDPVFLDSIFPYRGESWGIWTLNVIANQRHLATGMGLVLLVLIFLADAFAWHLARTANPVAPPLPAELPRAAELVDDAPVAARVTQELA